MQPAPIRQPLAAIPELDSIAADPRCLAGLSKSAISALLMRSAVVQSALTAALANEEAAEQPVATRAPAAKRVEPVIDPLLTVPTVAERLGYCASQVYEMLRAGRLPAVRDRKFVRVRESALAKFIADHERRGPLPKRVSDMLRSIS